MKLLPHVLLFILVVAAGPARATDFVIEPGRPGNSVTFHSKATIESFDGSTDQVKGNVTVDPGDITRGIAAHIVVDLASLDTGIDKRNTHMRERHLETDKYPEATLDSVIVVSSSSPRLEPGTTVTLKVAGRLDLHGVVQPVTADVEATYDGSDTIHIVARFKVNLSDFRISRPKFLVLKLAEDQEVTFEARARAR